MDSNAKPVQENPRRVPIPVKDEHKSKIEELKTMGVIVKVTEPTPGSIIWLQQESCQQTQTVSRPPTSE